MEDDMPLWSKDPATGEWVYGAKHGSDLKERWQRVMLQGIFEPLMRTKVQPDFFRGMDVHAKKMLFEFARSAAEGWVARDEVLADRVKLLVDPDMRIYRSHGHRMHDGESDAVQRAVRPSVDYDWAQKLWDTEGEKGATIEILTKSGHWKSALLMGVENNGARIRFMLEAADKEETISNQPQYAAPTGHGPRWLEEVKAMKGT